MTSRFYFKSLTDDQHAYTLHSRRTELDSFYTTGGIAPWAGMFATYGHDLVQHSSEWPAAKDRFADYLGSLAQYILHDVHPSDRNELLDCLVSHWPGAIDPERIRFLTTIRCKPDRVTRYSLTENKTSTASAKRYDRRWEEIPSWADGSLEATYRLSKLYERTGAALLDAYVFYSETRTAHATATGQYGPPAWRFFDLGKSFTIHQAFESIESCVKARIAQCNAERQLDCYLANTRSRPEPITEEPALESPEPTLAETEAVAIV